MLIRGYRLIGCAMSWAVFGLAIGIAPAQSQTACGPEFVGNPDFCQTFPVQASVPPSPPVMSLQKDKQKNPIPSPGYPVKFAFIFLCSDAFDGHLLDCGYSVEMVKPIDSNPGVPSAENGGHIAREHGSAHPVREPKDQGNFTFAAFPGSKGDVKGSPPNDPPKMVGRTGGNVALVIYPVPQASGDLLAERFLVMPPLYLCSFPGCFDQVNDPVEQIPLRHGKNRQRDLVTVHIGVPLPVPRLCPTCPSVVPTQFPQLIATPDDPFTLIQGDAQRKPHPENHFGTALALDRVRQIAQQFFDMTNNQLEPTEPKRKLKINDLSLVRGGVYDLNKQWFGDNTGNPHWGHRTGTEVDIDTTDSLGKDTSCDINGGGNDLVESAVTAVIPELIIPTVAQGTIPFLDPVPAHKCEARTVPGGANHVYLQ
ncbi:MAG: hypothetical protein E6K58_08090 [Nitrospirae bacterium]|nr:MAG: hypothetical protein E6K58_08090 [Nitrospirota bacterium]